jgi:hypothetical protein
MARRPAEDLMNHHRPPSLRAAVAQRQRSQDHLRAATATVGVAGVVTAGAVAFILPGATHATASSQPASAPRPAPAASSQAAPSSAGTPATASASQPKRHRHHRAAAASAPAAAPATPAPASTAPAPVASTAPSHGTSGGS